MVWGIGSLLHEQQGDPFKQLVSYRLKIEATEKPRLGRRRVAFKIYKSAERRPDLTRPGQVMIMT